MPKYGIYDLAPVYVRAVLTTGYGLGGRVMGKFCPNRARFKIFLSVRQIHHLTIAFTDYTNL